MGALQIAMLVMQELPALIAAGRDVAGIINRTNSVLTAAQLAGRDPNPAEWADLNFLIRASVAEIDAT